MHANEYPRTEPEADWTDLAACRSMPLAVFFPPPGNNTNADRAKTVCATCPVQVRCLDEAMAEESGWMQERQRHGVRGGLTAAERGTLARKRRSLR